MRKSVSKKGKKKSKTKKSYRKDGEPKLKGKRGNILAYASTRSNYYVKDDKRDWGGRPTKYNKDVLAKAIEYRDHLPSDEVIHTIEGLSDYLMLNKDTIYEWIKDKDKKDFSDVVKQIFAKQGKTLVSKGLNGIFTPAIAKVILVKHDYRDSAILDNRNTNMNDLDDDTKKKISHDLEDIFN